MVRHAEVIRICPGGGMAVRKTGRDGMKFKYNAEKLQKIADDFVSATELSVCIYAPDRSVLAQSFYRTPEYCYAVQKSDGGAHLCECSDSILLDRCKRTKQTVNRVCHAGLTDTVVPIVKDGTIFGYIMIGRIRQSSDFDKVYDRISAAGSYEYIKSLYEKVKYYNELQTRSIAELALMLTSFILINDIICFDFDPFAEEISDYIENNLENDLSIPALCSKMNVSKNCLYEHFHASFGCTVNEYIAYKRTERAKQRLTDTDMPISRIAEKCGIFNYTYFCKLFKRKTGISPLRYRKINRTVGH